MSPRFPSVEASLNSKPKVLLVDDEIGTLQLVHKVLELDGYEVHEAIDGEEAIHLFERVQPDVVLLDVIIPKIDGIGVLGELRERDHVVGIIMVSALSSEQLALKALVSGADDYMSKPFKLKTLRARIRQVIEKANLRRQNQDLLRQLNAVQNAPDKQHPRVPSPIEERPTVEAEAVGTHNPLTFGTQGRKQMRTWASVLCVDYHSLAPAVDAMPAERAAEIAHDWFEQLDLFAESQGVQLCSVQGNSCVLLCKDDFSENTHAARALQVATQLRTLGEQWSQARDVVCDMCIGIHTGRVTQLKRREHSDMPYLVIGDAVDVARQLCLQANSGQVLLTGTTYRSARLFINPQEIGVEEVSLERDTEQSAPQQQAPSLRIERFVPSQSLHTTSRLPLEVYALRTV